MKRFMNVQRRKASPTIRDVAELAKVSIGTVSRVINAHENVAPALRDRVQQAIGALGYRPNVRAQRFVRDSAASLSFILANRTFYHPVHPPILQGVADYCEEQSFFVLFTRIVYEPSTPASELALPRVLRTHGAADCVILAGLNHGNLLESLDDADLPYVVLGNSLTQDIERKDHDIVSFDDQQGSREAVAYAASLGHRDILFIGDTSLPWFESRYRGYLEAVQAAGLTPLARTAPLTDDHFGYGQASVTLALEQGRGFSAVFAGLDAIAYGAITGLRERGLAVPEDVSVIGFGDQYGESRLPALTTVHVDTEEVGRRLAQMAIAKTRASEERFPEVVLPCTLVRRATCLPHGLVEEPTFSAKNGPTEGSSR